VQEQKTRDQTEIIVMLTPHILRMPDITRENMQALYTGSETIPRLRQMPNVPATGSPAPQGGVPTPAPPATAPAAPAAPPAPAAPSPTPAAPPNPQPQALRQTNSTIMFSPSPVPLPPNGTATLNVIGTGNDFYGADLTLAFEPGAIDVREVREGGFLSRDGQIVAFVQNLQTESGMLHISLERPPGAPPISGTGNLVTLVLARGMRPGDSTIRVTDFRVRDPQQNEAVGQPAEVRVIAP
jgi:hypothetical protein